MSGGPNHKKANMKNLEAHLQFIERFANERRYRFPLFDLYAKPQTPVAELCWVVSPNAGWEIVKAGESQKANLDEVLVILNEARYDLVPLQAKLVETIKTMIIMAELLHKDARELLGEGIVESTVAEFDGFAQRLAEAVASMLNGPKTPRPSPTLRVLR